MNDIGAVLPEIIEDLYCPNCVYNLRGLTSDRCPECGELIDRERLGLSQIPWSYRREIGRRRAYWRTAWLVMFGNDRFCREAYRPVDYPNAQAFRWATAMCAYVPFVLLTVGLYVANAVWPIGNSSYQATFGAVWPIAAGHVGLLMFLAGATGLPGYFFHPRHLSTQQQDRCIALSYYGSAALAWTPLTIATAVVVGIPLSQGFFAAVVLIPIALAVLQAVFWLMDVILIAKRGARRGPGALVVMGFTLPVLWLLLAIVTIVGVPAVCAYFGLMYLSFHL